MEQNSLSELTDELNQIDVDSIKLDAVIQLKTWQKKMQSVINRTYANRLQEIDSIAAHITNEIKEKQNEIEHCQVDDQETLAQLKNDIDALKANMVVVEAIPENFEHRIERTIRVQHDDKDGDDDDEEFVEEDDEPVIVDIDQHDVRAGDRVVVIAAAPATGNNEGTVSRIFSSQPVQHALATGLAKALVNMGTIAATSTTTVAATTMAKTALIATACGIGTVAYGVTKVAMGTTRKVWSLVVTSEE